MKTKPVEVSLETLTEEYHKVADEYKKLEVGTVDVIYLIDLRKRFDNVKERVMDAVRVYKHNKELTASYKNIILSKKAIEYMGKKDANGRTYNVTTSEKKAHACTEYEKWANTNAETSSDWEGLQYLARQIESRTFTLSSEINAIKPPVM